MNARRIILITISVLLGWTLHTGLSPAKASPVQPSTFTYGVPMEHNHDNS